MQMLCWIHDVQLILLVIIFIVSSALPIHPTLEIHQLPSTSLRLRILPRAITYLNKIAADIIAEQLPRIQIANVSQRINNGQGNLLLSRLRVSHFKRAQMHQIRTTKPNKITWDMKDLNIGLIGDLSGEVNIVIPLKLIGEAEVQALGVDFRLESALERADSGAASVTTISCRTTIKKIIIENYNGGIAEIALNIFKQAIAEHIRPLIQSLICKKVTQFINEDLNKKLSQTHTESVLADAIRTNSFAALVDLPKSEVLKPLNITFFQQLAEHAFIDFRLSEDPLCYSDTIELANRGEITLKGTHHKTPFGVPPLNWRTVQSENSMIHLLFSDYIANALLYQAFIAHMLQFVIDEDTLGSFGSFLRTTCTTGICFADLLPQIAEKYPDTKVKLIFNPTRPPAVMFQAMQDGLVTVSVNGLIFVYVIATNSSTRQAAIFELDLVASNHLYVENNTLLGTAKLNRFELHNKVGGTDISDEELSDIALLGSQMLQGVINNFLRTGCPIPIPDVLRLKATELQILDRAIFISSEFLLDRRKVSDIALEAFANNHLFTVNSMTFQ